MKTYVVVCEQVLYGNGLHTYLALAFSSSGAIIKTMSAHRGGMKAEREERLYYLSDHELRDSEEGFEWTAYEIDLSKLTPDSPVLFLSVRA
jgi:hypothetical protein